MTVEQIMQEALEALTTRKTEIDKAIVDGERKLAAARLEAKTLERATREQRAAIDRTSKRTQGRSAQARGMRLYARHAPAEGTKARLILDTIKTNGSGMYLRDIGARTSVPMGTLRSTIGDLVERGYVERVSEGIYKATESSTAEAA